MGDGDAEGCLDDGEEEEEWLEITEAGLVTGSLSLDVGIRLAPDVVETDWTA